MPVSSARDARTLRLRIETSSSWPTSQPTAFRKRSPFSRNWARSWLSAKRGVPITKIYGTHPITQNFRDYTTYPETRTVEPDGTGKKGIQATALVKTAASSRALTKVDELFSKGTATLDDSDRRGPLSIAVAVEAKLKDMDGGPPPAPEGRKAPDEARLVVFGTPRFADNQELAQFRLNGDLFLNAVGWLVGQEELVSIRSRSVRASRAELTQKQAVQVFYLSVLILPQLLIAAGIGVWWRRKSR